MDEEKNIVFFQQLESGEKLVSVPLLFLQKVANLDTSDMDPDRKNIADALVSLAKKTCDRVDVECQARQKRNLN